VNRNDRRRVRAAANNRRDWYRIQNAANEDEGPAEILIYDEIGYSWWGGISAQDFAKDLNAIESDEITVRLNSPGGDVFDGIAILNALRAHKARITVYVDGLAASAASFIAMAGDEVVMRRNSELMIHDAWGFCQGNAEDMHKMAADLDRVSDNIASIYSDRSGGTVEDWRNVMRQEVWYSDQEAVDAGLADRVDGKVAEDDDAVDAKAAFDLSIFNYAGRRAAPPPPIDSRNLRHANRAESRPGSTPRASTIPAATPAGSTQEGGSPVALTLTDEQETSIREALGLAEDVDADAIVTAIEDLATAPPETDASASASGTANASRTAALPDGVVAVDADQLAALQAQAARGVAAAERQDLEDRERIVNEAVRAGKIPPARKNHWLKQLEADAGAADTLNSLAPGLVPVGEPIGHGSDASESDMSDDELDAFAAQLGVSKGALRG
jgi:ATP-dependent Clp endopeptidase proteolytic subunit ClpP